MPDHTPVQRARWRELHGRPAERPISKTQFDKEQSMLRAVPEDGELKPLFVIESRPSSINGILFWAVLSYKEHMFDEPLPQNFMGLDEAGQNLALAPVAQRLKERLRPIIEAEDAAKAEALDDTGVENTRVDQ